jgi:hypothetical protein
MASTAPAPITVSIESGLPGSGDVTIRTGPESAEELRQAFSELGLPTADVLEHSAHEVLTAVFEVVGGLSSVGALNALVKGLSTWLHRNDGKEIDFEVNGTRVKLKGISEAGIAQILGELRAERDDQWRSQLPDRFPSRQDDELQ